MTGWLVAGVAGLAGLWLLRSAWRDRREFTRHPDTFRCRVRVRSAALPGFPATWSRTRRYARWVHGVLVVRTGFLSPRTYVLPVRVAEGEIVELDRRRVRGLGPEPVSVRVLLDDQSAVEVATSGTNQELLAGPFVVLTISRLR